MFCRDTSVCLWGIAWSLQQHFPSYQIRMYRAPRNIFECFFLSGYFAFNCSPVHDKVLGKAGDVFRKMADSNPIFHDRDAVLVAELASIGIRLRRQLFANYRIPVDPVYMIASNNTRVYEFHVEWMVTDRLDIWVLCRKFSAWHHMGYWILTAGYCVKQHQATLKPEPVQLL